VIREISTGHPLVNGNKRLAFALGVLLRKAGYELSVDSDATIALMLRVARGEVSKKELEIQEDLVEDIIHRYKAILVGLAKH